MKRLSQGRSLFSIWKEILDDTDPEVAGAEARGVLASRIRHLKSKGVVSENMNVPHTAELRQQDSDHES